MYVVKNNLWASGPLISFPMNVFLCFILSYQPRSGYPEVSCKCQGKGLLHIPLFFHILHFKAGKRKRMNTQNWGIPWQALLSRPASKVRQEEYTLFNGNLLHVGQRWMSSLETPHCYGISVRSACTWLVRVSDDDSFLALTHDLPLKNNFI